MARRHRQRGQALVVVALGLVAFFAFLGVALDGASAYLAQLQLQRDADMAAISGSWAYYHASYEEVDAYGSVSGGMDAARTAVQVSLAANGFTAAPAELAFIGVSGSDLDTSQCPAGPACPGAWDIRGVRVRLSTTLPTQVLQSVGVGNPTIQAASRAELGPNTGAAREAPLLLQGYNPLHNLPRVAGYGSGNCATNPPDGYRYPANPVCRPSTGGTWTAGQLLSLEPAWSAASPEVSPFDTAPRTNFFLLHEPASSASLSSSATEPAVESGLTEFLPTCSVANPGDPCPTGTMVYADSNAPAADAAIEAGMIARITKANQAGSKWQNQHCATPHDPANPLMPDNPRLVRLPVTYAAGSGTTDPSFPGVGGFHVSETVLFCVDSVPVGGGSFAVSGYLVEEPTVDPTVLRAGSVYFGRDVVVRLLS